MAGIPMRMFHTIVVAVLALIVLAFVIQNFQMTTISLLGFHFSAPLALVSVVLYLLGMITGGSVVSLFKWAVTGPEKQKSA